MTKYEAIVEVSKEFFTWDSSFMTTQLIRCGLEHTLNYFGVDVYPHVLRTETETEYIFTIQIDDRFDHTGHIKSRLKRWKHWLKTVF